VMHADKIVLLDRGTVAGIGTHEELLRTSPLYRRLYETQFRSSRTRTTAAATEA